MLSHHSEAFVVKTEPEAPDFDPDLQAAASWYVAYTKSRQEEMATANLQRQGFHVYFPLFKTFRTPSGKIVRTSVATDDADSVLATFEPMFPRYVFFKPAHAQQSIATVRSTRGVTSIVSFGAQLAVVQPQVLQAIKTLEQQRNQAQLDVISPYQPGRRVRLRTPALNSLEGLVQAVSSKRVTLLLEILGRQKTLRVEHDQIELV